MYLWKIDKSVSVDNAELQKYPPTLTDWSQNDRERERERLRNTNDNLSDYRIFPITYNVCAVLAALQIPYLALRRTQTKNEIKTKTPPWHRHPRVLYTDFVFENQNALTTMLHWCYRYQEVIITVRAIYTRLARHRFVMVRWLDVRDLVERLIAEQGPWVTDFLFILVLLLLFPESKLLFV